MLAEQIQVQLADQTPVAAINLDTAQELLWTGNEMGRVASLLVRPNTLSMTGMPQQSMSLDRYTSFRSHFNTVRQILTTDHGVYSIGANTVRHTHRRGLVQWTVSQDNISNMTAMTLTQNKSELLVAGQPNSLLLINLYRGIVMKQIEAEDNIIALRRSRLLCCGTAAGKVTLRDPRTLKAEHSIDAHSGALLDMDVGGNILITCGYSNRGGRMISEPMVKLYDIRTMRALPPLAFPAGPTFLKFHPGMSSTIFASSQLGQFQIVDILNPDSSISFHQANISGYLSSVSYSSSGDILALGGSLGTVSLWSEKSDATLNAYSRPVELPDTIPPPLRVKVDDNSPLSLVGMPYYTTPLLSSWSDKKRPILFEVGKPTPRIPPEVLSDVKMIDFVGYAKNPGTFKRNQAQKSVADLAAQDPDGPKFRSEQGREKRKGGKGQRARVFMADAASQDESSNDESAVTKRGIPKYYRRVEIKYSKFGVEDFDFGFYNKTEYSGLETHILNSYCNAFLQVLFFTKPLRAIVTSHIASLCSRDPCLCCELGFLVRMLEDGQGMNCHASNFLRVLKTIPQANALGVLEPETHNPKQSYSFLIQNFNRFIFEQLNMESSSDHIQRHGIQSQSQPPPTATTTLIHRNYENDVPPSFVEQVMGLRLRTVNTCQGCLNTTSRETYPFVVDLVHRPKQLTKKSSLSESQFCTLLETSINRETFSRSWCSTCSKNQSLTHSKVAVAMPKVLSININMPNDVDPDFYMNTSWTPPRIAVVIEQNNLNIYALESGSVDLPSEIPETADVTIYDITATISEVQVDKEPSHLVSSIYIPEKSSWYLFNDFLVQPIVESEAIQFQKWKVPAVFQYTAVDLGEPVDYSVLNMKSDPSSLTIKSLRNRRNISLNYPLLSPSELPNLKGFLCAIDAEFVALNKEESEIRSDGSKFTLRPSQLTLARVSVLRGDGPMEGIPFIDDYVAVHEPVVDYLTEFSGIKEGDLDPTISTYPLVTRKVAYQKLRLLLDMGCIFIGHGLKKDFRTINLIVPPDQVIDTVELFFKKERSQRLLSLRFLSWSLLRHDIQKETHDSVEDAHTALLLYKKYLELKENGTFEEALERVFEEGKIYNFKAPVSS